MFRFLDPLPPPVADGAHGLVDEVSGNAAMVPD